MITHDNLIPRGILACCMHDDTGKVADYYIDEGVTSSWFSQVRHAAVWSAIVELRARTKSVGEMDVSLSAVQKDPEAIKTISSCMDACDGWSPYKDFMKGFREEFHTATLKRGAMSVLDSIKNGGESEEILAEFKSSMEKLDHSERTMTPSSEFIPEAMRMLREGGKEADGMPTGLNGLDRFIGGLKDGKMYVIAARPGMGKTSIAMNFIEEVCVNQKEPTAFYSMEMKQNEIGQRFVSTRSGVGQVKIKDNLINQEQKYKVGQAELDFAGAPLWIYDKSNQSMAAISSKARRMANKNGLSLIVIDYLSLVTPSKFHGKERHNQVDGISRDIKNLAGDLNVPVIALVQLGRDVEKSNRKPRMSDMREAGGIEQDADVIIALHEEDDHTSAEILKQRDGSIGSVKLTFRKWCTKFVDYEEPITK